MSKSIAVKLTKAGIRSKLFTITDEYGNVIKSSISKEDLINGISFTVDDNVSYIKVISEGACVSSKQKKIEGTISPSDLANTKFTTSVNGCLWRHLTRVDLNNNFYGSIHPYILEYPYASSYQDEILQSIKDFSRVYKYTPDGTGVFDYNNKAEVNDVYFSHLIIYNGQQNSGLLELVKKPKNNLSQYLSYPIYRESSKVITYTKSDSFYNINTFWNCLKDVTLPMFKNSCESLSKDKELNQDNIDYSKRSFRKDLIRGKATKVRYILSDRSDIHIVSKINFTNTQLSYK